MEKQGLQKDHKDQHCRDRSWYVGERVMVRNLRPGSDWIPGVVVEILGPVTYLIDVGRDQIWKRHADQLKSIEEKPPSLTDSPTKSRALDAAHTQEVISDRDSPEPDEMAILLPRNDSPPPPPEEQPEPTEEPALPPPNPVAAPPASTPSDTLERREYPSRSRQTPNWYHAHQWH